MKIKVRYIRGILKELVDKTGQHETKKGFEEIAEQIPGISSSFLYKMKQRTNKLSVNAEVRYHDANVNSLLKFLDYRNIGQYVQRFDHPINPLLRSLIGNYYSYLRRSMDTGTIFRSVVAIKENEGKLWMNLSGGRMHYAGEMKQRKACIEVLLDSGKEKFFHHVYQIGENPSPQVLQGVFVGTSNTLEPIAGRVVLIRQDNNTTPLKNDELSIDKLKKSKHIDERRIAAYFNKFSENNLALKRSYTFETRDLQS